ncbi:hypothetical protein ACFPA8_18410 [Streptomyces ovatisporus]|uniref:Integral membrane protein n=1 Tax=Streptomyces ovatisporus TaxID=1128682 RepID=A0ABV9AB40_9ACTN
MPEANISPTTDEKPPAPEPAGGAADGGRTEPDGAAPEAAPQEEAAPAEEPGTAEVALGDDPAAGAAGEATEDTVDSEDGRPRPGLTPRQARRVRVVVSGVVMVAVAVALFVRLVSAPSVLTVGFYGIALILSGTAIGLSRRGRTRVAGGVLVLGFGAVALAEWLLASVQ